ncbi:MAG: 50S ribosomal protein L16 [Candidatus Aenigmarchaeota archaeon]|nr:50S ribosomal protein L16 [Candidatus Aenigmarchaeota archaeon]
MGLRPGRCYRKLQRPNTRQSQRVPKKGYVKGVPGSKISQFEMGTKAPYETSVFLVSNNDVQIRHNALEAARMAVVKALEKNMPRGSTFFFKIRIYPHHVLRENAMATGAGADRFQTGMRQSFGNPIGTAAQVHAGQRIFEVKINHDGLIVAKKALKLAVYKLPTQCHIATESLKVAA